MYIHMYRHVCRHVSVQLVANLWADMCIALQTRCMDICIDKRACICLHMCIAARIGPYESDRKDRHAQQVIGLCRSLWAHTLH